MDLSFRNRLDPEGFVDAESVGLAVVGADEPGHVALEDRWRDVPEPLWSRLLLIGRAYELDFPDLMSTRDDTVLDAAQCRALCEELRFIARVVADPALAGAIDRVVGEASGVAARADLRLIISPP